MGGGTTVVEALKMGRRVAASDINSLAHFVARAKTTPLSESERADLVATLPDLVAAATLRRVAGASIDPAPPKNLTGEWWRVARVLWLLKEALNRLKTQSVRTVAQAALLRTGQWSVECNDMPPTVDAVRDYFANSVSELSAHSVGLGKELEGHTGDSSALCAPYLALQDATRFARSAA